MALTAEELDYVERKLWPQKCLCGAVAKMFLASPDPRKAGKRPVPGSFLASFPQLSTDYWTDSGLFGGLLLVHDPSRDCFAFQLINLETMRPSFQYELYFNLEFLDMGHNLYAFEVDDCVLGFLFSDTLQGQKFYEMVYQNIPTTKKLKQRGRKEKPPKSPKSPRSPKAARSPAPFKNILRNIRPKSPGISAPQAVEPINNMRLNEDGTLDMQTVPKEWRMTLKQAGFRPKDLKDPKLVASMMNIIEEEDIAQTLKEQNPQMRGMRTEEILNNYELPEREEFREYAAREEELKAQQEEYEAYQAEMRGLEKWEKANEHFVDIKRQTMARGGARPNANGQPRRKKKKKRPNNAQRPLPSPRKTSEVSQLRTNTPLPPVPGREEETGRVTSMQSGLTSASGGGSQVNAPRRRKKRVSYIEPLSKDARRRPTNNDNPKRRQKRPRDARANEELLPPPPPIEEEYEQDGEEEEGYYELPPPPPPPVVKKPPPRPIMESLAPLPKPRPKTEVPQQKHRARRGQQKNTLQEDLQKVSLNPVKRVSQRISQAMGRQPAPKTQGPSFLAQIARGDIKLKETGNWMQTTVKRVNQRMQENPDERTTIVRKLQKAIEERRMALGEVAESDSDDDDWDIDD